MRKAVELALDHIGRKMGPLEVEVIYGDDEFNPQKGKQRTEKLVKQDDVDCRLRRSRVTGTMVISGIAGTSHLMRST